MESKPLQVEIAGTQAKDVHDAMRSIDRREWWLWSYAVAVTILLMVAVGSFAFPSMLAEVDASYSFFLNQAVRALAGLVLLFNVYMVHQQFQINKLRRQ